MRRSDIGQTKMHLMAQCAVDEKAVRDNIKRFNGLGLFVSFTEIDIRIESPLTELKENEQVNAYKKLMEIAMSENKAHSYIVWGYTDTRSWIPGFFPGFGNANIFDKNGKPKAAYKALAEMIKGH